MTTAATAADTRRHAPRAIPLTVSRNLPALSTNEGNPEAFLHHRDYSMRICQMGFSNPSRVLRMGRRMLNMR
jgi:hypothetical protein